MRLDVVLTVVGSKVADKAESEPGSRVTWADVPVLDVSTPIWAVIEPVVRAGVGLVIPVISKIIIATKVSEVIAAEMVTVLAIVFMVVVMEEINAWSTNTYVQISDPLKVN